MSEANETDTGKETSESAGGAEKTAGSESGQEVDFKAKYEETLAETRKWEKRAKDDFDAAKKWREHEESQKTEDEKRAARERELEERATKAEIKALKSDVADAKKIPVEWRARLSGSTKEELEADADELLKLIAADNGRKPDPNQGKTATDGPGDFLRESLRH